MDPNRTPDNEDEQSIQRRSAKRSASSSSEAMTGPPGGADDEFDGQLGPDELPDALEVVMNQEAKRHH